LKDRNKNSSANGKACVILLSVIYFILYFMIVAVNKSPDEAGFNLFGHRLILSSCNGILISLQTLICIIFSGMAGKSAKVLSHLLPVFSILSTLIFIIRDQNPEGIPGITMFLVTFLAVSVIYRQIKSREKESLTDYLTGQNNRRSIMKHLEHMVRSGKAFGILYIDIDDFKFINDNYGHESGDKIVKITSDRIAALLNEKCVFGRIGGDEFVVVIQGVNSIKTVSEAIMDAVKQEIVFEETGVSHFITASIGIAKFPDDAHSASELIRYADIAMYNVKTSSKNAIRYFDKKFEEEMNRISSIESLSKDYLQNESFRFEYQPQYCARTKTLRGFETLIRIRDEDRKMVSIQELISVAEKSDIIYQIDEYVLRHALEEFKPVAVAYPELTLSVNASAKHLSKIGFVNTVRKSLEETGFPPECLEIEITEYCLAGSVKRTIENMNELREMGIKIALDDFGTGYASLSYLSKLPVNLLKIDKSFIDLLSKQENTKNADDFISAIISMGHILGCEVISEGVESQHQLDILREKNCDFIQGFLWGAPLGFQMASKLCDDFFKNNQE